ncbi:MAG: lytic transglycosylase domain-containing protein [Epulopiscium sp.]|nr:lytic transglycosylase domain-containing protein [Candidatus Epulonipiscium sp.]
MFYIIDLRGKKLRLITSVILSCIIIYILTLIVFRTFLFPVKYADLVIKYSEKYNLDAYLVFSIIRVESKFNPQATSHKGAKGLMQITDQTGEWAAKEIGIENYYSDRLYEPEINIQIGCWYIRKLINQYKNNLETSLAAYNAGSGNVSKWLENEKYSRDSEKLHFIPFKETREYVKKVVKSRKYYEFLYKNSKKK